MFPLVQLINITVVGQMSGTAGQIFFVNSKNFYSFHRLNHKRYDNETNGLATLDEILLEAG